MNNVSIIAQQLIQQPIALHYRNKISIVRIVAGIFLLSFFLFIGICLFIGGLKAEKYGIYYLLFGTLLCSVPFILLFLIINNKNKSITLIDKAGVTLKNNKKYNWENLRGITYHTSLYEQIESEKYISIEFFFEKNNAFVFYDTVNFFNVLYIADRLPVPINEIAVTRFK